MTGLAWFLSACESVYYNFNYNDHYNNDYAYDDYYEYNNYHYDNYNNDYNSAATDRPHMFLSG